MKIRTDKATDQNTAVGEATIPACSSVIGKARKIDSLAADSNDEVLKAVTEHLESRLPGDTNILRVITRDGAKGVFIGDSITDALRNREDSEDLGGGYVRAVYENLTHRASESRFNIINRGVGGNEVAHLESRWEQEVIAERPDWISVSVGINDALWKLGQNEDFSTRYRNILQRAREHNPEIRIVLCECFIIGNGPKE